MRAGLLEQGVFLNQALLAQTDGIGKERQAYGPTGASCSGLNQPSRSLDRRCLARDVHEKAA